MRRILFASAVLFFPLAMTVCAHAQLDPLQHPARTNNPVTQPTLSSGQLQLLQLDIDFAMATLKNGGKGFSSFFADDAVTLNNGKPVTYGKSRIAADANWDPKVYQLQWQPLGAEMGPSGDMGFTWGHYDGHSKDAKGNDVTTSGRYITVWKKVDGKWKVAMDASANDVPAGGDCCALPKP
jgi:ketosteroid isomerase-like protein